MVVVLRNAVGILQTVNRGRCHVLQMVTAVVDARIAQTAVDAAVDAGAVVVVLGNDVDIVVVVVVVDGN